jgi:hypothetical protein
MATERAMVGKAPMMAPAMPRGEERWHIWTLRYSSAAQQAGSLRIERNGYTSIHLLAAASTKKRRRGRGGFIDLKHGENGVSAFGSFY